MTEAQIIARVRKMLALASNNPSAEEAASAAAEAQRLMLEYQLGDAVLEDRPPPVERAEVQPATGKLRACMWQADLAHVLGRHMHVETYYTQGTDRICAIGRATDVAALCVLYHHVKLQLDRAAREAWGRANRALVKLDGAGRVRFTDTFMRGARDAIDQRMVDMRRQVAAEADRASAAGRGGNAGECSALVRMDHYASEARAAIARFKASDGLKLRTHSRAVRSAGDEAYGAGRSAGERASLTANARALAAGSHS